MKLILIIEIVHDEHYVRHNESFVGTQAKSDNNLYKNQRVSFPQLNSCNKRFIG